MYLLGLKYLKALPAITQGKGTTIFLASEATGVMGALGGMRAVLRSTAGEGASASNEPVKAPVKAVGPGLHPGARTLPSGEK